MKTTFSTGTRTTLSALMISAGVLFAPALAGMAPAAHAASSSVAGLPDFADMVDKVGPAVVNIRTTERLKLQNAPGQVDAE